MTLTLEVRPETADLLRELAARHEWTREAIVSDVLEGFLSAWAEELAGDLEAARRARAEAEAEADPSQGKTLADLRAHLDAQHAAQNGAQHLEAQHREAA